MGFRDVSKEIAEVASGYHFTKTPGFVEDFLAWLARVTRAVIWWLTELFQHSGGAMDSRGLSFLLQMAVYVVAAIAVIALVVVMMRRASTARSGESSASKGATAIDELLDAQGWQRKAETLAVSHDYKGACRALYLSLLQRFHENEIAQFAPTKTNYEYSYSLAKYPKIQDEFKQLAERVELIWFGNKDATIDDYDQSKRQLIEMDPEIGKIGLSKLQEKSPKA